MRAERTAYPDSQPKFSHEEINSFCKFIRNCRHGVRVEADSKLLLLLPKRWDARIFLTQVAALGD